MKSLVVLFTLFIFSFVFSADFVVVNTNDAGPGSLRDAIEKANALPGADVIRFNIPGNGIHYIQPTYLLPELTDPVTIDGYSQLATKPATPTSAAHLRIVIDGSLGSDWFRGLHISSNGCVVKGLVICNFSGSGIIIQECSGNTIQGNIIGLDVTGSTPQSNRAFGILVEDASDNLIGGNTPAARNIISANYADGVSLSHNGSKRNRVLGNFIGTDATGTVYLPNGEPLGATGLRINDSADNIIGGLADGERNLIMGMVLSNPGVVNNQIAGNYINTDVTGTTAMMTNFGCGIFIIQCSGNVIGPGNIISGCTDAAIYLGSSDPSIPTANTVIGNFIGTDPTGTQPVPNCIGIKIEGNSSNTIGGPAQGDGNIIAHSRMNSNGYGGSGVVVQPIWNGPVPVGNAIVGNSIYDNDVLGIDLGFNYTVDANDPGDTDDGPNKLMNFPVIESAIRVNDTILIKGTIDTQNPENVTIDFYVNSQLDEQTDYGEGENYLGSTKVSKKGKFTVVFASSAPGQYITATATDADNNTSEFSLSAQTWSPPNLPQNTTAESEVPHNFVVEQNYPNPFNPTTTITYNVAQSGKVKLTVYNALGQGVAELVNDFQVEGSHSVTFDASHLSTGIYFYQVQVEGRFSEKKKMMLLK
jgi:hypothetical protein